MAQDGKKVVALIGPAASSAVVRQLYPFVSCLLPHDMLPDDSLLPMIISLEPGEQSTVHYPTRNYGFHDVWSITHPELPHRVICVPDRKDWALEDATHVVFCTNARETEWAFDTIHYWKFPKCKVMAHYMALGNFTPWCAISDFEKEWEYYARGAGLLYNVKTCVLFKDQPDKLDVLLNA